MFKDVIVRETSSSKPKKIGKFYYDENCFQTTRDYTKHLLRKHNAWAIDYKLLEEFLLPRNSSIVILDSKRSTVYKTTAKKFKEQGKETEYLNHRKQIYMNLGLFEIEKI